MSFRLLRLFQSTLLPAGVVALIHWLTVVAPSLQTSTPLFLFLGGVMLCLFLGGTISGIVATAISALVVSRFPAGQLQPLGATIAGLERVGIFCLICGIVIGMHWSRELTLRRLHQHRQRMAIILQAAHMGVWDYNLLKRKFWWSQTLESVLERRGDDFPSSYGRFFTLIHFDDQPVFNRAITRTIDEGCDYDVEHRMLMPDNTYRLFRTRGRLLFDRAGRAERIVAILVPVNNSTDVALRNSGNPRGRFNLESETSR